MTDAPKSEQQLRLELWHQAYKLALGNKSERESALPEIAHLVMVLQHMKEESK